MKQMEETIAQYKAKIADREKELVALKAELLGYQKAVNDAGRKFSGKAGSAIPPLRPPRSNVKQTVLELLHQRGADGLNASTAVELAKLRNETIHQPTVSSLLSRFKSDGIAVYDGSVYRLKQFAPPDSEVNSMH